ncbi:hypothetical protein AB3N59_04925 [Leptospira sp. WS92.C1]
MKILKTMKLFFSDNIFRREIKYTISLHLSPKEISHLSETDFFKSTIKTHLIFLILYVVINFTLSLFNLTYLIEYSEIMRGLLAEGKVSLLMYVLNSFPYNLFAFGFLLILFELYFSIGSYLTLKIFGESGVSFLKCLSIVISSNLYILLSLFPVLFLFSVMPDGAKRDIFYMILFVGFVSVFVIAGIVLQMLSFIRVSKTIFNQNSGRGFLTWFFPVFVIFLFFYWSIRPI